jgi:CarD family transcriptional regulator
VKLVVGSVVSYPPHGVGRIAARERSAVYGVEHEVVVVELADGLSVTLPVQRAREVLRPLAGESEIRAIQDTLRQEGELGDDIWSKRRDRTRDKLRSGDPRELAEIVRDGAQRERAARQQRASAELSASERELYLKARDLLAGEISLVRGLTEAEADIWIDEQLAVAES